MVTEKPVTSQLTPEQEALLLEKVKTGFAHWNRFQEDHDKMWHLILVFSLRAHGLKKLVDDCRNAGIPTHRIMDAHGGKLADVNAVLAIKLGELKI